MLGSIVGPAVVGETEEVGADVDLGGEAVEAEGSGLAPPPHADSKIEAAKIATGVFFTVPPTVLSASSSYGLQGRPARRPDLGERTAEDAPYTILKRDYARFAALEHLVHNLWENLGTSWAIWTIRIRKCAI